MPQKEAVKQCFSLLLVIIITISIVNGASTSTANLRQQDPETESFVKWSIEQCKRLNNPTTDQVSPYPIPSVVTLYLENMCKKLASPQPQDNKESKEVNLETATSLHQPATEGSEEMNEVNPEAVTRRTTRTTQRPTQATTRATTTTRTTTRNTQSTQPTASSTSITVSPNMTTKIVPPIVIPPTFPPFSAASRNLLAFRMVFAALLMLFVTSNV